MLDDDVMMRQMRELTRQHLRTIWELSGVDESTLSEEDRVLVEIMRMHPEYYDLWGRLDEVSDEELERDGSNPIIHVMIHQVIENQIAAGEPAETTKTLDRLLLQGMTQHEALHQIGTVVADEIFGILKDQRVFDEQGYVKKLRRLTAPRKKRGRRRRSRKH